ncbi:uncharacterized protein znf518b [Polymixia lowei]
MNPVKYQKIASSLNGVHEELGLDSLLSTSKVMYCEKCGFFSTDSATFNKHMLEHMATRFYCFYCNHVSYSEMELHAHLQQHTTKYLFRCQFCGQRFVRGEHLLKHIEQLHPKGLDKLDMTTVTHAPASPALSRMHRTEASSVRPTVKVTIPPTIAPPAKVDKDRQRGNTNVLSIPKAEAELLSPLNEPIQHNRALTVSLPEEITIPAGCSVELVEVKTVNGTKELKLRLVSQQENESVLKASRSTISQNTTLGKPLLSTLIIPKTYNGSFGTCTVKRKQCEIKNLNVECPAVSPVNVGKGIPNPASNNVRGIKRTLQETKNQNAECPSAVPAKVTRRIVNPASEGTCGVKITPPETLKPTVARPTIVSTKTANQLTSILNPPNMGDCVTHRKMQEKNNSVLEHPTSSPTRKVSHMQSIPQDLQVAVKEEPSEMVTKDNVSPDLKEEAVKRDYRLLGQKRSNVKSSPVLNVPATANAQEASSTLSICNDKVTADPSTFLMSSTGGRAQGDPLSNKQTKVKGGFTLTNSKSPALPQSGRCNERAFNGEMPEPEGFPVISSVFSLCQQPDDVQSPVQPLVMALRGIVMSKSNSAVKTSSDHTKTTNVGTGNKDLTLTSEHCVQVGTKDVSFTHKKLVTQEMRDKVKIEEADKCSQYTQTQTDDQSRLKEEARCATSKNNNKYSLSPHLKSLPSTAQPGAVSNVSHTDSSVIEGIQGQILQPATNQEDIPSKFLTVSLKRIKVRSLKRSKKRLKLRKASKSKTQAPMGSLCDNTVLHPAPLKVDQLVIRPGPNQPVVVLNHPKPKVPRRTRETTIAGTGTSEVVPKCQILKMRLSKVMGQKYEVIGCTVRVFS